MVSWESSRLIARKSLRSRLSSGAYGPPFYRAVAASVLFVLVFSFFWSWLIPIWPYPLFEALLTTILMAVMFVGLGFLQILIAEPDRYTISDYGITSNLGRWKIPWDRLLRWNIVFDPEFDSHVLVFEEASLRPRRIPIPDEETLTDVIPFLERHGAADQELMLEDAPFDVVELSDIPSAVLYLACMAWGVAFALLISWMHQAGVAPGKALYWLLLVNLVIGPPGWAGFLHREKTNPGNRVLSLRVGFMVNALSSTVAIPFTGLFMVAFYIQRLL